MTDVHWRIVIVMVLLGHFGFMLSAYNRINAFGFARWKIKTIVKAMLAFTIILPPIVGWLFYDQLTGLWLGEGSVSDFPIPLVAYAYVCLFSWVILGIPWLIFRPIFGLEWVKTKQVTEVVSVQSQVRNHLPLSRKCKLECRLPLNQLFELAIDQIELPVVGLPGQLDGYRIAHLSDIHLTGDVHPDFARYAVNRATQWEADLMAVTGDIIDKKPCIDWLGDIFGSASAIDGRFYVLGNHDTRVYDSWRTREAMDLAGWTDLGARYVRLPLRNVDSMIIGNEYPWYERPTVPDPDGEGFRLLLSHSPDQLKWARRNDVTLMLAGHTHGGQGRLPLAGPLLSPSGYGSRYASGSFYKSPTTMHVSRGLCGTHLIRINCRPQLSLLSLRAV